MGTDWKGCSPDLVSREGFILGDSMPSVQDLAAMMQAGALCRIAAALEALADPGRADKIAEHRRKKAARAEYLKRSDAIDDACKARLNALIPHVRDRSGVVYWRLAKVAAKRLGLGHRCDWAENEEDAARVLQEVQTGTFTADDLAQKGTKKHATISAGMASAV